MNQLKFTMQNHRLFLIAIIQELTIVNNKQGKLF